MIGAGGAAPPWQVSRLELGTHSRTHIDAASHYVPDGASIDTYPLERFVLDCAVAHLAAGLGEAIGWDEAAAALPAQPAGRGLLLHTGWDERWGGPEARRHPFLAGDAARRLAAAGVGLVGTDALNVDATQGGGTDVHEALLGGDVLIVENLTNLGSLEAAGCTVAPSCRSSSPVATARPSGPSPGCERSRWIMHRGANDRKARGCTDGPDARQETRSLCAKASGLIRTAGTWDVLAYNVNFTSIGLLLLFLFLLDRRSTPERAWPGGR